MASEHRDRRLAAVVLHYRHWPGVGAAIEALRAQAGVDVDITIVDNASNDGSVALLRAAHPDVAIVECPENLGYAAGMNVGLRAVAPADPVLLLTHDCVLDPSAVDLLWRRLAQAPGIGAVGPLTGYRSDPRTVLTAGGVLSRRTHLPRGLGAGEPIEAHRAEEPYPVDWITGSCMLVRRAMVDALGGFDERYFMYFEETDLCVRAARSGWRLELVPDALAWQEPGTCPPALWSRNELRFLRRNFGFGAAVAHARTVLWRAFRGARHAPPSERAQARLAAVGVIGAVLGISGRRLYGLGGPSAEDTRRPPS